MPNGTSLVLGAYVPFGQHQDTELWNNQFSETNILGLPASRSPVPELSFLPAPYRGWTRAGETRVQDNLHAHAQNEPIKNYQVPTTLLASMCRAMPFSARALKENIFFHVDIDIKNIKP